MREKSKARSKLSQLQVPEEWTFKTPEIARAFDSHVREQLPWYDMATGAVAHIARCFIPHEGTVIDVGASTGNIGRALASTLKARNATLMALDASESMADVYEGPGDLIVGRAEEFDFFEYSPDLIVCFLSLMFVPVRHRSIVLKSMKAAIAPGGALIVVDKIAPRAGYVGTVNYRLTLAAKHEAGAQPHDILRKELSLSGVQRPLGEGELDGFTEFFRFGDFAGFVWEQEIT